MFICVRAQNTHTADTHIHTRAHTHTHRITHTHTRAGLRVVCVPVNNKTRREHRGTVSILLLFSQRLYVYIQLEED